jgi:hypothetical protein
VLVFAELRGASGALFSQILGGSVVMALGAGVIALSTVSRREHERWRETARREAERYGVDADFTRARAMGRDGAEHRRGWVDWTIVGGATAVLVGFAAVARAPQISANWGWASALIVVMIVVAALCGRALWRTTRFS